MYRIKGLFALLKTRLSTSPFLRGFLLLMGGTSLSQAVGVIASPILTRLYTPEAMGMWGLFASFVGLSSAVGSLRYDIAIVASKDTTDALLLTRNALLVAVPVSMLFALVFVLFSTVGWLGYSAFPLWVSFLVFLAVLASIWAVILRYWVIRMGAFGRLAQFVIVQAVYKVLSQVALFFFGNVGLILGEVLGRVSGVRLLWQSLPRQKGRWLNWRIFWAYRSYPLIQLPSSLLDTLALLAPVPVFSSLYGIGVAGSLSLAQRIVSLPLNVIGGAVADVFYHRAAELARKEPEAMPRFVVQTFLRLGLLAIVPGLVLWFAGTKVCEVLFGPAWRISGEMASAYAPWMVAQMAVSPVSRVVFLSKLSWMKLVFDVTSLLLVVGVPYMAFVVWDYSAVDALWALSWANVFLYLAYFVILIVCSRQLVAFAVAEDS